MKLVHLLFAITLVTSLLSCQMQVKKETINIDYGNNENVGKYIDNHGVKLYCETYGDLNNEALLLVHGNGGSIKSMKLQIDYFKDNYFCIIGDNRSFGKSIYNKVLNYNVMADDYNFILDELGIEKVNILGHSDGGIIALLMAINYPEKMIKAVAAVPNLVPGETAIEAWELELGKGYMAMLDSLDSAGDTSSNWDLRKEHMLLMKNEPHITHDDLATITCPVLLMTSDDDIIKPRHILEIYENIPNAQMFMMPGATHFMIRDEHEFYNKVAFSFLSEPFKRPSSQQALKELIGIE